MRAFFVTVKGPVLAANSFWLTRTPGLLANLPGILGIMDGVCAGFLVPLQAPMLAQCKTTIKMRRRTRGLAA
ncbi:hypothetical protein D3C78_499880 [compost metagenome]